jgi:hypothetical protein
MGCIEPSKFHKFQFSDSCIQSGAIIEEKVVTSVVWFLLFKRTSSPSLHFH